MRTPWTLWLCVCLFGCAAEAVFEAIPDTGTAPQEFLDGPGCIRIQPDQIEMRQLIKRSDSQSVRIFNRCQEGEERRRLKLSGALLQEGNYFSFKPAPSGSIGPGESFHFRVGFLPKLPGETTDTLTILSDDDYEPEKTLLLRGTGVGPLLRLDMENQDFGRIPIGSGIDTLLTLYNDGNQELIIHDIFHSDDLEVFHLQIEKDQFPLIIPPVGSDDGDPYVEILLTFAPIYIFHHNEYLVIESSDPITPTHITKISGEGIPSNP